ncbi:MAG: S8 family serine peptidase [Candidatus Heimdallarchaeaceae archaeon]
MAKKLFSQKKIFNKIIVIVFFLSFFTLPVFFTFSTSFPSIQTENAHYVNKTKPNSHNLALKKESNSNVSSARIDTEFIIKSSHIEDLHEISALGQNVKIAILSTGLSNHSIYYNQTLLDFNAIDNSTEPIDNIGIGTLLTEFLLNEYSGISPKSSIMNIKVMDETTTPEWISLGINKAIEKKADIILLGVTTVGAPNDIVSQAIKEAEENNILVFLPSGDFGPSFGSLGIGAVSEYGLVVGSAGHKTWMLRDVYSYSEYTVSAFSGRGPTPKGYPSPHLISIGENIAIPALSILNNSNVTFVQKEKYSSTLLSAATVAGGVACSLSYLFNMSFSSVPISLVKTALIGTSIPINKGFSVFEQGNGYVNIYDCTLMMKDALENSKVVETVFPHTIVGEPYIFYNKTSNTYFSFIHQSVPLNVIHFCYNPLYEKISLSYSNYEIESENVYSAIFKIQTTSFSGSVLYSLNYSFSPYFNKQFTIRISSSSTDVEISLELKVPQKTVSFDTKNDMDGYYFGDTPYQNYWTLTKLFAENQIMVKTISDFDDLHTDLLILADIEQHLSTTQLSQVSEYMQEGGTTLFIANNLEFQQYAINQTFFRFNETNKDNLAALTSCTLVPENTVNKTEVIPSLTNLMSANLFWFINPLIVERSFVNEQFFNQSTIIFDQIISSGLDISVDLNNANITSLIGTDWIHGRGVKLAVENIGKGKIIISSTDSLFSIYGEYFSENLLSSFDKSFLDSYILSLLFTKTLDVEINILNKITLVGSSLFCKVKINSPDVHVAEVNAELIALFVEKNRTYSAKKFETKKNLLFSLPIPFFYQGKIKFELIVSTEGAGSFFCTFNTEISPSPLGYDIIAVVLLLVIIIGSSLLKITYIKQIVSYSKIKRQKKKNYCPICKLPLKEDFCHFCNYKKKKAKLKEGEKNER